MSDTVQKTTAKQYAAERAFRVGAVSRVKRLRRRLRAEGVDEARVQRECHRFRFKLWRQEYGEENALVRLHCAPQLTHEEAAERLSWLAITAAQREATMRVRRDRDAYYNQHHTNSRGTP